MTIKFIIISTSIRKLWMPKYSKMLYEPQANVLRGDVTSHVAILNLFISHILLIWQRHKLDTCLYWTF